MLSTYIVVPNRLLIYRTNWNEFTISTYYHKSNHYFFTYLIVNDWDEPLEILGTREWSLMKTHHMRALHLCWEIISHINEGDEF